VTPADEESISEKLRTEQDAVAERRRRRWLNVTLAVGLMIAGVGFYVETRRALEGHVPAWVYVVEWPLLAVVGFRFWQRLIREDITTDSNVESPSDMKRESWKEFSSRTQAERGDQNE
jgi:hypothetical protein